MAEKISPPASGQQIAKSVANHVVDIWRQTTAVVHTPTGI